MGRPQKYATNAERQRAYRERNRPSADLRVPDHFDVPRERDGLPLDASLLRVGDGRQVRVHAVADGRPVVEFETGSAAWQSAQDQFGGVAQAANDTPGKTTSDIPPKAATGGVCHRCSLVTRRSATPVSCSRPVALISRRFACDDAS